jgi:hypothetical protein
VRGTAPANESCRPFAVSLPRAHSLALWTSEPSQVQNPAKCRKLSSTFAKILGGN